MKTPMLLVFILCFTFLAIRSYSQCEVEATASPDSVCPSDPVIISMIYQCAAPLSNNFNSGTIGAGWIAVSGVSFTNPCNPTSDGSTYLWMGSDAVIPRKLSTSSVNATTFGIVSFDLKYATQSQSSPCEGIDEMDEGISFQYSTDNGTNWFDIAYFRPDGVILSNSITPGTNNTSISVYNTPFTTWTNYEFFMPSAAQTTSTAFRWIQQDYSSPSNDHWGLDNIVFHGQDSVSISWSNGVTTDMPFVVYPESDTSFIVVVTNLQTGSSASDTVYVNVFEPEIYISGNEIWADTVYQTYYWIDCSTGATIPGENNQSFSPSANGSYALYATTFSGCSAQSDCIDFSTSGIEQQDNPDISLYPVPTGDYVTISNNNTSETAYFLYDVSGKLLLNFKTDSPEFRLDLSGFSAGSFLLKASNNQFVRTFRIEKL